MNNDNQYRDCRERVSQDHDRGGACSQHSHGGRSDRVRRWARHGSTRYIWDIHSLETILHYVRDQQDSLTNYSEFCHDIPPSTNGFPLAYFITFRTYGTFFHGDDRGSVDRKNNIYGAPFITPNHAWENYKKQLMTHKPFSLDSESQLMVKNTIIDTCNRKGWILHAINVLSTHIHVVVTSDIAPEFVMKYLKAYSSKALNDSKTVPRTE